MNINEIKNNGIPIFEANESEIVSFAGGWKNTFETISRTLDSLDNNQEKERILNKIAGVINILVRNASTYEDLVINIAQIYIFMKETSLNAKDFENVYGKKVVDAVGSLNNNLTGESHLKMIFENEEYKFLGKIKLAEIIETITSNEQISPELLLEIDEIIKIYQNNANQKLMKLLKELRLKIK